MGGAFTSAGPTHHARIARLDATGKVDLTFDTGFGASNTVNALALCRDGKVLIGGAFANVNGVPRNRVARLHKDGSVDVTFNAGAGPNSQVLALVLQNDGKILIGGQFSLVNGVSRNRIARLEADGNLDLVFDPGLGANSTVDAIASEKSGKIYIGGFFSSYDAFPRDRIARLNGGLALFEPARGQDSFSISVSTFSGQDYLLEYTDSLSPTNWASLPAVVGDGTVKTLTDPTPAAGSRYYRVRTQAR